MERGVAARKDCPKIGLARKHCFKAPDRQAGREPAVGMGSFVIGPKTIIHLSMLKNLAT